MDTPLQNSLGHLYGPGRELSSEGVFPIWLEQTGSAIMGGIIDLQHQYKSGVKVADVYPEGIISGTACYQIAGHKYVPVPTFRLVKDLGSGDSTVEIANFDGHAKLVNTMKLLNASQISKSTTVSSFTQNQDGNYVLTISPGALGEMKSGDCLILDEVKAVDVKGLTKSNLEYKGADPNSKLNVTLVDRGRILSDRIPALPKSFRQQLQTIKFEEE